MMLLAQNYAFGYVLIGLAIFLGLLSVCIPRPRKKFAVERKRQIRKISRPRK